MATDVMGLIAEQRVVSVVRAEALDDPLALAAALHAGGIDVIELTFTTPGVEAAIETLAAAGHQVGAGTVMTRSQALSAIGAGASFLVTPCLVPDVVAAANENSVPIIVGALTPTEVNQALSLGAGAVKIFPASSVGPRHISNLLGPFPGIRILASGGIDDTTARSYLDAGAIAVAAGSGVVSASMIANGEWARIEDGARRFTQATART